MWCEAACSSRFLSPCSSVSDWSQAPALAWGRLPHAQCPQDGPHLGAGFRELEVGDGVRHDAATRENADLLVIFSDLAAPQGDSELAITRGIDPSHGSGVTASLGALQVFKNAEREARGSPTNSRCGVQGPNNVEDVGAADNCLNIGGQVRDVGEVQKGGLRGYGHRLGKWRQGAGDGLHSEVVFRSVLHGCK